MVRTFYRLWMRFLPFQLVLLVGAIGLTAGLTGMIGLLLLHGGVLPMQATLRPVPTQIPRIGSVFTAEVQYWTPKILAWAAQYGIDPNILATVIQIESCGDPDAGSSAGAQGLFQVMPFHFDAGEDMLDPDTNARRGINYLLGGLDQADGHIGLALAGYNGGWGVIDWGWGRWSRETRLYYVWGTQIYVDALQGKTTDQSQALQSWLNAGGSRLCAQANARLFPPTPTPTAPADVTGNAQSGATPTILIIPKS